MIASGLEVLCVNSFAFELSLVCVVLKNAGENIRSSFRRNCNSRNHGWHTTSKCVSHSSVASKSLSDLQKVAMFSFLKKSDRKRSYGWLIIGYSAGKSDAKSEEPVDWSFAVLELLREQGWDVKEMNDRYKRDPYLVEP